MEATKAAMTRQAGGKKHEPNKGRRESDKKRDKQRMSLTRDDLLNVDEPVSPHTPKPLPFTPP